MVTTNKATRVENIWCFTGNMPFYCMYPNNNLDTCNNKKDLLKDSNYAK